MLAPAGNSHKGAKAYNSLGLSAARAAGALEGRQEQLVIFEDHDIVPANRRFGQIELFGRKTPPLARAFVAHESWELIRDDVEMVGFGARLV